jgi:hypothetical protein
MAEESLLDFAVAEPTDSAVETTTTEVETPTTETQTEIETPTTETEENPVVENVEKTEEEKAAAKIAAADKLIDTKATPDNVRKALKAMRDASPANGAVVKELHGAFERWNAAKAVFPKGVSEMQEAKDFIESIGGTEGYEEKVGMLEAVKATDELLYTADPVLSQNVYDDMKAQGKQENYGQVVGNFVSHLKTVDPAGYYKHVTQPLFFEGLVESHMPGMLNAINNALNATDAEGKPAPNIAALKGYIQGKSGLSEWFKDLETDEANRKKEPEITPERKKFEAEKAEFEKTKAAETTKSKTTYEEGIATDAEHYNNRALGAAFAPFLKMAYFKEFPRETKVDIGNGIKERLYATLKADRGYQRQMDAFWKKPYTPELKAEVAKFHNATLDRIANDVVTKTIQTKYPGYAKGGSAAGRVAAANVKKTTENRASAQSVATGKPLYVASRPTNLVRDEIKIGEKVYSTSDLTMMQITGKGFVKTTDGKGYRLVTWRK